MALQLTYNEIENCYLKAIPTTIQETIVDDIKIFQTFITYEILFQKEGEIIMRDCFLLNFNPNESIFTQMYDNLKKTYTNAINI